MRHYANPPLWQAKATDGTVVMTVDSAGNLDASSTTVQTNATVPQSGLTNSFVIKSTTNRFVFNKTNAYIAGSILESQSSLPATNGSDLVVKNSGGTAVALFETTTGNIYLKAKSCGATIKVYNCTDLQNMKNNLSGTYELANSFSCATTTTWNWDGSKYQGFEPVGSSTSPFTGKFDGKGYQITGLYINRPTAYSVGLFGIINSSPAEIKNVGLLNVNITGNNNVGGLVGENGMANGGTISNSYSTGVVSSSGSSDTFVGGLVGLSNGTISNSYSTGVVSSSGSSNADAGGLVGYIILAQSPIPMLPAP